MNAEDGRNAHVRRATFDTSRAWLFRRNNDFEDDYIDLQNSRLLVKALANQRFVIVR